MSATTNLADPASPDAELPLPPPAPPIPQQQRADGTSVPVSDAQLAAWQAGLPSYITGNTAYSTLATLGVGGGQPWGLYLAGGVVLLLAMAALQRRR